MSGAPHDRPIHERLATPRTRVNQSQSLAGRCWVDGMPMQVAHKLHWGLYDERMVLYCVRCGARLGVPIL